MTERERDLDANPLNCDTVHGLLKSWQERTPQAGAILGLDGPPLDYAHLWTQVFGTVESLAELGIGHNDRVAIVLPNGPRLAVAFLAVCCTATSAPLNPQYRELEFDFFLSDLNARAVLVETKEDSPVAHVARKLDIPVIELQPSSIEAVGTFGPQIRSGDSPVPVRLANPDDEALVLHTSGTTSKPKMVPLSHRNLCVSARNIRQTLELDPRDRCLNVMPLFHIHGLVASVLASLSAGASVACTPGFYAPEFSGWLGLFEPSWYTAVPAMHQAILKRASEGGVPVEQNSLRFIRSSSAPLLPQVHAELERTFQVPVIEAYGMTEAAHQIASNPLPPGVRRAGSVGLAAGPEVAIMAEGGENLLPAGEAGEIVIRGPNVMAGYANNPDENRQASVDGWFRTGDLGFRDESGYLTIAGRLKEIINRGGEKISPLEVDEVLLQHPAVSEALTFALPDPKLGQDVAAAVTLRQPSVAEQELRRFVALRLAHFKVPRRVIILDEIPGGPTGKHQRVGLAQQLGLTIDTAQPAKPAAVVAPRTGVERALAQMWVEILGITGVGIHQRFLDLGGDSMLATRLVARVRQMWDLELTLLDFFEAPTIAEQAVVVEALLLQEIEALPEQEAQDLASRTLPKDGRREFR